LFIPLSLQEVGETMWSRGFASGPIVSALALLGMGGGTYGPKTKYQLGTEAERTEQFAKDLKAMEWDSKDPAYRDFLTSGQMEQVGKRREERRQSLAYSALANPDRKDYQSAESFDKAVAERDAALKDLRTSGMGSAEVRKLLIDYWKRVNGSAYEIKGGNFVMKEGLVKRLRQAMKELGGN